MEKKDKLKNLVKTIVLMALAVSCAKETGSESITDGLPFDFYIALLPVSFESGITVNCYDSNMELIAIKKTTAPINTVSASGAVKILNLGNVQDWLGGPLPVAVDLGLPSGLKWASFNVGATMPEEYGDYIAWGETQPKANYNWYSTYKWSNGSDNKLSKYCTKGSHWDGTAPMDNKAVLDLEDDAAYVNWGGSWRIPTDAEWKELMNKCTWKWTTQNGVSGRLVKGPNGNSIFLPAAGSKADASLIAAGSNCDYWSSSLYSDNPNSVPI